MRALRHGCWTVNVRAHTTSDTSDTTSLVRRRKKWERLTRLTLLLKEIKGGTRVACARGWLQTFLLGLRGAGREKKMEPISANQKILDFVDIIR